ncbi:MAG: FAD-dependent thymidylate synthase [Synergistaceae bacterium]|nr:FAD-dependent thymidylate synthase [Synergistaceae bacterium]
MKGRIMNVILLTSYATLSDMERFAALAALTCHAHTDKDYVPHEVLGRIIKAGHESILEHITLTYSIKGLSRACLQELARHRHISLSVESTRHTLKKQIREAEDSSLYPVPDVLADVWKSTRVFTDLMITRLRKNPDISNDELKYYLPEFWPTNLIMTANIRELRHIIRLRTAPAALREFRVLAYSLYEAVPDEFKYLLADCVYKETDNE